MTTSRPHPNEDRTAAVAADVETDLPANDATGTRAPVDFTGQRVVFSDGAPVSPSRKRGALQWFREHNHVAVHVHLPHLTPPDPTNSARRYSYLEQALMSREMDRL